MQLFNRTKKNTTLAPEVQAFAQAERRERMGMAWLVGVVSLVVTVLVAMVLFYGGRWVYRSIANRGDKATPVVTEQDSDDKGQNNTNTTDSSTNSNNASTGNNSSTNNQSSSSSASSSTSTPSASTPAQQPVTGDDTTTLPNTGPDVDL